MLAILVPRLSCVRRRGRHRGGGFIRLRGLRVAFKWCVGPQQPGETFRTQAKRAFRDHPQVKIVDVGAEARQEKWT